MGADFSKVLNHLAENLQEHAWLDGMSPVRAAVFLDRGGHAPGEVCPRAKPVEPQHHYLCSWPDDECTCHQFGVSHDSEASR